MKTYKFIAALVALLAFRSNAGLFEDYAADFEKLDAPTELLGRRWSCVRAFTASAKASSGNNEAFELSFARAGAGFELDPANSRLGFHFSPSPEDRALVSLARLSADLYGVVAIRGDASNTRLVMEFSTTIDEMLESQEPDVHLRLERVLIPSKLSRRRVALYMIRCERAPKPAATTQAN